jgi:flavodoxin
MKKHKILAFILVFFAIALQAQTKNDKILVTYFSWSGNAKVLAEQIAQKTGGDLFEIKTVKPYPSVYDECTKLARQELDDNARPAISGKIADMKQYKTVFLCYPNWWGTMPMALFTFLEAYDFSGKTIFPLVTHGGSRFGRSIDDIKRLVPKAVIGEGLSVSAMSRSHEGPAVVKTPNEDVNSWLKKIGMIK